MIYNLASLIWSLRDIGYFSFCRRYEVSADNSTLYIVFFDYILHEQFITVFRTSVLCYRVYYNGKLYSARTLIKALDLLDRIRLLILDNNKLYGVMTVSELKTLRLRRASAKADIFRRLYTN